MPAAPARPSSWPHLPLAVALASSPLYAALLLAGDLTTRMPFYLGMHAALFGLYLLAVRWALRVVPEPAGAGRWSRGAGLVLAAAIVFRLILLPSVPSLSGDIWRYIWEGGVQWHGINPYRHAPADPELAGLRDAVYDRINHRDLPAIYPPLTQGVLALGALAGRSPQGMKTLFVAADVGVVLLLLALLRRRGEAPERAVVYAWHPLVVVEVAGSGHNDPLAIALLLLATAAIIKDRPWVSMTALALSGLAKLYPWVLVPLYMPRLRRPLLVLPIVAIAGYLPYAGAGSDLARSAVVYAESWRSNDLLFGALVAAARATGLSSPLKGWADAHGVNSLYAQPHMLARLAAALLLAGWMWRLWLGRRRGTLTVERAVFLFTGGILLLMPTLHPWYLLWILPWLALFPSPAWLALSGLVPLAYTQAGWAPWAQYLPFFALLGGTALWRRLRRRDAVIE